MALSPISQEGSMKEEEAEDLAQVIYAAFPDEGYELKTAQWVPILWDSACEEEKHRCRVIADAVLAHLHAQRKASDASEESK